MKMQNKTGNQDWVIMPYIPASDFMFPILTPDF